MRARDPIKRWPVLRTRAIRHHPYEVISVVGWCGHRQELVLVPDGLCQGKSLTLGRL